MKKWIKWLIISLVGLVLILAAALIVFIASFDPNSYKSKLQELVFDKYARTLSINGDIGLKLFPDLALQLEDVSLSEAGSDARFAAVDNAYLSLAVWPLLSNHLQINHIKVAGLEADIKRADDGRLNFDDLLRQGTTESKVQKDTSNNSSAPSQAEGEPKTNNLAIDVAGIELTDSQINYFDEKSGLRLNIYKIQASSEAIHLGKPFSIAIESLINSNKPQLALHVDSKAQLTFTNDWRDVEIHGLKIDSSGDLAEFKQAQANLSANLSLLDSNLEVKDLHLNASGDLAAKDPINAINFKIYDGALNLQHNDDATVGNLSIGKVNYKDEIRDVDFSDFATDIKQTDSATTLKNIAAKLYGGKLAGEASRNKNNLIKANIDLKNISLQPLLKSVSGKNLIAGNGNAKLDINTNGANTITMQKELAGNVELHVSDGYVLGVNIKRTLIQLNELFSDLKKFDLSKVNSPFSEGEKTSFSKLDFLMNIKNGVGTVNNLLLHSDLVNVSQGKPAQIDIAQKNLNLVINAKIARDGNDSNKLNRLLDLTIPVYITGAWANPSYSVKLDDLLKDQLVQGALESGLNKLLGKDKKSNESKQPSAKEKAIGKALKGLFGD